MCDKDKHTNILLSLSSSLCMFFVSKCLDANGMQICKLHITNNALIGCFFYAAEGPTAFFSIILSRFLKFETQVD